MTKWIQQAHFTAVLLEESIAHLLRADIFLRELGVAYHDTITVKGVGKFVLQSEHEAVERAIHTVLKPSFHFISIVNQSEHALEQLLTSEELSYDIYRQLLEEMSKHLAYYGLAKAEAEYLFSHEAVSPEDKNFLETWRNDTRRWRPYDALWNISATKMNIPVEDIHVMLVEEFLDGVQGKEIDLRRIQERKAITWSLVEHEETATLYLEDHTPVVESRTPDVLTGLPVYTSGRIVQGVVGKEVLVVSKTHPDMVGELSQYEAIVTDEGGILSHAAIIARELHKPCIVGTHTATTVLQPGDRVEVDTEKGTVRRLSS
jgi:phosphohistidine swiveling domain-containing protein